MEKLHPALLNFQVQRYQKILKRDKNDCPVLELGTSVLCWKPDLFAGKLGIHWSGPFKVHRRLCKDSYILKCPLTRKEYRRHISLIRPLRRKLENDKKEFIIENNKSEKSEDPVLDQKPECPKDNQMTPDDKNESALTPNKMLKPSDGCATEDIWKNRLRSRRSAQ